MDYSALAALLFPTVNETPEALEQRYPPRQLPEGARVCRMAPSPTGFMHLGNLFGAVVDERLAHQSGGVFYLRIEDTDQKREVPGGVDTIIDVFEEYALPFDEGATRTGDNGQYGPYRQRQRAAIYHVCAKWLVQQGLAYPCFLTEDELADMRQRQAESKLNFGCYGQFAKYRDAGIETIQALIDEGKPYVIRLRSPGSLSRRIKVDDLARGVLEMPENDQDVVLLKADGIPTYHFAHVVDDHLMRTTVVVRGEEWLATLPIHIQLFSAMGWKPPRYLHTAQLMKMDNGNKRKLSKRKDPELALGFYSQQGYAPWVVKEYLMTLLNSNFEEWRAQNPDKPFDSFPFSPKKMGVSGALFSLDKLNDVSKTLLSRLTAEEMYRELGAWAARYDAEFAALLGRDTQRTLAMLAIGRGGKKPRKDIAHFSEAKAYFSFYFDELFAPQYTLPENVSPETAVQMLGAYRDIYQPEQDNSEWFDGVKQLAQRFGYATDMKAYKAAPKEYPGSVADVSGVLRVAITGRAESPDLAEVCRILGHKTVKQRLTQMADALQNGSNTAKETGR